jgi:hypothetical protein
LVGFTDFIQQRNLKKQPLRAAFLRFNRDGFIRAGLSLKLGISLYISGL